MTMTILGIVALILGILIVILGIIVVVLGTVILGTLCVWNQGAAKKHASLQRETCNGHAKISCPRASRTSAREGNDEGAEDDDAEEDAENDDEGAEDDDAKED
ncbi:unnamed protein product, partial [Ascophyllum nodosum]